MSHECMPKVPEHTQSPYITKNGVETTVDANLAFTLELFKLLGVETMFSCEDNYGCAYILGNGRQMLKVELLAKKLAKQGRLTPSSKKVVNRMFGKRHSADFSFNIYPRRGGAPIFGAFFRIGNDDPCVTKDFRWGYGFRSEWRWPADKIAEVDRMLSEVLQFA